MTATLLGWLVVLGIGVPLSIALHEVGHLVPAKRFGVACTQYMIGFGPTLWSRTIRGTEYGIKALPLGGYVRMLGMFPPGPNRPAGADTTGRLGAMIEAARADQAREIPPEYADKLFYQRTVPQRLVIMFGGPFMNLVIAVVLLSGLITLYGIATSTTTVAAVSQCVVPVSTQPGAKPQTDCTANDPKSPAAAAGIKPGDQLVAFNGTPVSTWSQVRDAIRANGGKTVQLTVLRDGKQQDVSVTPLVSSRYVLNSDGTIARGPDGQYLTEPTGFLGVTPTSELVRQPISAVPGFIGSALGQTAGVVIKVPQKMVGVAKAAFSDAPRDPEGPIGLVGVGRLAGEVGSATVSSGQWGAAAASWLSIVASLNLALFVFNLVPLLPLDGGHIAGALWEGARRRVARWFGRPDPGPVDIAKALPLAYAVGSLFVVMTVLLLYADIVNPIRLGS